MKPQRREQLAIIALDAKHHFHHPFGQPPVQVAVDQRFEVERLASPGPVAHTRPKERADRRPPHQQLGLAHDTDGGLCFGAAAPLDGQSEHLSLAIRDATEPIQLIVPPEGTRSKTRHWKTGFFSSPTARRCRSSWPTWPTSKRFTNPSKAKTPISSPPKTLEPRAKPSPSIAQTPPRPPQRPACVVPCANCR